MSQSCGPEGQPKGGMCEMIDADSFECAGGGDECPLGTFDDACNVTAGQGCCYPNGTEIPDSCIGKFNSHLHSKDDVKFNVIYYLIDSRFHW